MAFRFRVAIVCCATLASRAAASSLVRAISHSTQTEPGRFCAPVQDAGAMGLVDVKVGSSAQKLSLLVDTGSNVLIVESCECQDENKCLKTEACFSNGTSETFSSMQLPNGTDRTLTLNFCSGVITGRVVKESVQVGMGSSVNMKDGMLMMLDRDLDFQSNFEGILGLGPSSQLIEEAIEDAIKQSEDELHRLEDEAQETDDEEMRKAIADTMNEMQASGDSVGEPRSFLEQAGFSRFSLCFGKGNNSNGTLVVGGPPAKTPLKSIGKLHWGIALEGVFVNGKPIKYAPQPDLNGTQTQMTQLQGIVDSFVPDARGGSNLNVALRMPRAASGRHEQLAAVGQGHHIGRQRQDPSHQESQERTLQNLCSRENMRPGQITPCGGIPDSGTTALAMPQTHLEAVAAAICDSWERCSSNFTALQKATKAAESAAVEVFGLDPFQLPQYQKADVLSFVLADCANFGKDIADIMTELPDFQVKIGDGTPNNTVDLSIPGASYVYRMDMPEETGFQDVDGPAVGCMLGLQAVEYSTQNNGDVWILGKPLFHEYNVLYDLKSNSIGFESTDVEPCGACQNDEVVKDKEQLGLLSSGADISTRHRAPLRAPSRFRKPNLDTTKPL